MAPAPIQNLIECTLSRQRGPVDVVAHVHPYCQFDVILGGTMDLLIGNRRMTLHRGDVSLIPPLLAHGFQIVGSVYHLTFRMRVHLHYAATIGHTLHHHRLDDGYLHIIESTYNSMSAENGFHDHTAHALATLCLIEVVRHTARVGSVPSRPVTLPAEFWDAVEAVQSAPHLEWSVSELADRCHLSEGHFTRLFMQSFQQTPQRFLLESRIWHAIDLLTTGRHSIKAVADLTGYATVHSFTRAFRRAIGTSPAAYLRSQSRL